MSSKAEPPPEEEDVRPKAETEGEPEPEHEPESEETLVLQTDTVVAETVEICAEEQVSFESIDVKQEVEVETAAVADEAAAEDDDMTYEGICHEFVNEELCETVHSDEEGVAEGEGDGEDDDEGEIEMLDEDDDDGADKPEIEYVEILEEETDAAKEYSCGCKQLSTPTATYTCDICDEKNTTEYIIETAAPTMTKAELAGGVVATNKKYVCSYCDKSFISNTMFSKHINAHLGKKIYVCKYCNELFTSNVAFIKHVKQHEREEEEDMVEDGEFF